MKSILTTLAVATTVAVTSFTADAATVKVTKFHQSYPYSGKATVEYTVDGTFHENTFATIAINTDDASATFIQTNVVAGANTNVIDFAESFGGAMLLTNATFTVTISVEKPGGVQLWENGPYWAKWNVGATQPWEYGYYFWWGDVVGYTISGGTPTRPAIYANVTWVSSAGEQMGSSPFSSNSCPTYKKGEKELLSSGYIDSSGNLAAGYDAATAHLGSPWRMPTGAEITALVNNCTLERQSYFPPHGDFAYHGYLFTGKGDYADRSIFIPRAGFARDSDFCDPDGLALYWSSSPNPDQIGHTAQIINDDRGNDSQHLYYGLTIRPVRDCVP